MLLHAWKDRLWAIGGEERPPKPRFLHGGRNGEEDTDEEQTDEEVKAAAVMRPETFRDGDHPRELSREGAYSRRINETCS